MTRGFPSMTALLALLAVAGYQNRDKIAEMLGKGNQTSSGGGSLGDILGNLGGTSAGGLLGGGLGHLIDRFKQSGQGGLADSWVQHGANQPISPEQLRATLGPDVLTTLVAQTGLAEYEVLARLSRQLPDAVDKYTPDGKLPAAA